MKELGNTPADKDYKPSGISKADARIMEKQYNLGYQRGYEQAEKDLAPTWEDMRKIIRIDEEMMDDPEAHPEWMEEQPFYEEMLRRFNEHKK